MVNIPLFVGFNTCQVVSRIFSINSIWSSYNFQLLANPVSYKGVSKNRATPKSSVLVGFSLINHTFWGTTIFGNTHQDTDRGISWWFSGETWIERQRCLVCGSTNHGKLRSFGGAEELLEDLQPSGQIIATVATSHDLTPKGSWGREIPLFQGNLGWWNIIIWPEPWWSLLSPKDRVSLVINGLVSPLN